MPRIGMNFSNKILSIHLGVNLFRNFIDKIFDILFTCNNFRNYNRKNR